MFEKTIIIKIDETALSRSLSKLIIEHLEQFIEQKLNPQSDELWTRNQTAKALNLSLPSLDRLSKGPKKILTPIRLGSSIRYKKSDVLAAISPITLSKGKYTIDN